MTKEKMGKKMITNIFTNEAGYAEGSWVSIESRKVKIEIHVGK